MDLAATWTVTDGLEFMYNQLFPAPFKTFNGETLRVAIWEVGEMNNL